MRKVVILASVLVASGCGGGEVSKHESAKRELVRQTVTKLAREAFPMWAVRYPQQVCPNGLEDLAEYTNDRSLKDAWGRPYKMVCGPDAPAGAKGFGVLSVGADGKEGTSDDIRSWDEP